ncbi:hypothetical protein CYLTODRAFT_492297 [Cylindrobasidium torrendii FP15055 ss-10]|uniref:DUF6533 domain-containing protein n=1 Tax=Cylindrobasidium torrendii FP15055 ss-10 TaxID=1314674 RepID=A0A0D7B4P0_9AGAR|nr:hypothetical protein CYLTODRAFT_492297 [Cylindrobasidium torrendii FP15055 ss-10]
MDGDDAHLLHNYEATKYAFAVALSICVFDIMITFDEEVSFVWMRKWSPGKTLFLINRYLPPLFLACTLYSTLIPQPNLNVCRIYFALASYLNIICVTTIQLVLGLRVYALYLTKVWAYLVSCAAAIPALGAVSLATYMWVHWVKADLDTPFLDKHASGCFYMHCVGAPCRPAWAILNCYYVLFESVVIVLTMAKFLQLRRTRTLDPVFADYESTFLKTLFHDGFLFYGGITVLAIANITVNVTGEDSLVNVFTGPNQAIRSTLCSRLFMHLRASHKHDRDMVPVLGPSTVASEPLTFAPTSRRRNHLSEPTRTKEYTGFR